MRNPNFSTIFLVELTEPRKTDVELTFTHFSKKMENLASINSRGFACALVITFTYPLRFGNDPGTSRIDFEKMQISILMHGTCAQRRGNAKRFCPQLDPRQEKLTITFKSLGRLHPGLAVGDEFHPENEA